MQKNLSLEAWIERITQRFDAAGLHFGHGTDNAGDEAAWLVLHAAGAPLDGSFEDWEMRVDEVAAREIERLADLRCKTAIPLAYLLGRAWFAGLEFEVDEHVLVPRSPIAELVREGFGPWVDADRVERILDLCAGSGCIGIATAVHLPRARVDLADISREALAVAQRNVARHGVGDRVRIYESDLFDSIPACEYDLITSNPPYVPAAAMERLPAEYRAEPGIGLVSGSDGLDAPLAILLDAARFLCEDGVLICEVGESEERLSSVLPGVPFTWLEFAHGGSGVFLLTREELLAAAPHVAAALEKRNHVT
ncbi:MAG: 50S ribosomal protein L3 N(5)-glutamine methyltransferase [Xanthomonadales bacterium]|jgi:ribosomal protein L3 glutamine methyltransferase|nr:50S ribosomal protein L3 N(5)-glutamine methyltransferase [Xanthomonadales bacterium]